MLDSNDALIDELLRRDKKDKALFFCVSMIFDAYYTMNKPEWINQENKEYRDATEKRFASYFKKHKELWDSAPQPDKMAISNGIRGRSVMEGMGMEKITIDDWLSSLD